MPPFLSAMILALGGLVCFALAWRARRKDREREAAEIRAELSDAVLEEEESLLRTHVERMTGGRLDRAREIAQVEREIMWAVDMLTRCAPEVERIWVRALKAGERRLQILRGDQIKSTLTIVPPPPEESRAEHLASRRTSLSTEAARLRHTRR